jgi:hypothetical protein
MNRAWSIVLLIGLAPFIMGGGGFAPGIPADSSLKGPRFNAVVVIDPHETGVTTTAKRGTIRISQAGRHAAAVFTVKEPFALFFGCALKVPAPGIPPEVAEGANLSDVRFLNAPLDLWIPDDIVASLFAQWDITVSPANRPIISKIDVETCTVDPRNPGPLVNDDGSSSAPGILSFQGAVVFQVPRVP